MQKYYELVHVIKRRIILYRQEWRILLLISEGKQSKIFLPTFTFVLRSLSKKGLVCKLAVKHQIRYTNRVDLPTDVAMQVVSSAVCGVVYPW